MNLQGGGAAFSRRLMAVVLMTLGTASCTTVTQPNGQRLYALDAGKLFHETVAEFDTPIGPGQLRKDRVTSQYLITLGPVIQNQATYTLAGSQDFGDLGLIYSQRFGNSQAVVFSSSTAQCPAHYILLVVNPDRNHLISDIGDCHSPLAFSANNQQFFAAQTSADDPYYWIYSNHREYGPILKSVAFPAPKPKAPPPTIPVRQPTTPSPAPQKPTVASNTPSTQQAPRADDQPAPAKHQMLQQAGATAISSSVLESSGTGKQMNSLSLMDKPTSSTP